MANHANDGMQNKSTPLHKEKAFSAASLSPSYRRASISGSIGSTTPFQRRSSMQPQSVRRVSMMMSPTTNSGEIFIQPILTTPSVSLAHSTQSSKVIDVMSNTSFLMCADEFYGIWFNFVLTRAIRKWRRLYNMLLCFILFYVHF